jgi:hypothetical protein
MISFAISQETRPILEQAGYLLVFWVFLANTGKKLKFFFNSVTSKDSSISEF